MARFKVPQQVNEGKIIYGDKIVDGIVLLAVDELEHVELSSTKHNKSMSSNAIKVVFEKDGVHVDVAVKIYFAQSISEMAFKVQEAIRHNVEAMTEYHIAAVNVIVNGVLFNEPVKSLGSSAGKLTADSNDNGNGLKKQEPLKDVIITKVKSVATKKSANDDIKESKSQTAVKVDGEAKPKTNTRKKATE